MTRKFGRQCPTSEIGKLMAEYRQFTDELNASGHFIAGSPLQPETSATSVSKREGKVLLTDGPFMETRETLGGYYLVNAKDLDEAVSIAERIPSARSEQSRFGLLWNAPLRRRPEGKNTKAAGLIKRLAASNRYPSDESYSALIPPLLACLAARSALIFLVSRAFCTQLSAISMSFLYSQEYRRADRRARGGEGSCTPWPRRTRGRSESLFQILDPLVDGRQPFASGASHEPSCP